MLSINTPHSSDVDCAAQVDEGLKEILHVIEQYEFDPERTQLSRLLNTYLHGNHAVSGSTFKCIRNEHLNVLSEALFTWLMDNKFSQSFLERSSALLVLAALGDTSNCEIITLELNHAQECVRLAAAKGLAELGDTQWLGVILGDNDDWTRLASYGSPVAFRLLLEAIKPSSVVGSQKWSKVRRSNPDKTRHQVAEALSSISDPRLQRSLIDLLEQGLLINNEKLLASLCLVNNDTVTKYLVDALADKTRSLIDGSVIHWSGEMILKLREHVSLPCLIADLGSSDEDVRKCVAEVLYELGEPKWINIVKGDSLDWQRLGESGDERAVYPLLKALCKAGARSCDLPASINEQTGLSASGFLSVLHGLSELGEPKWLCLLKDCDNYKSALGKSNDPRIIQICLDLISTRSEYAFEQRGAIEILINSSYIRTFGFLAEEFSRRIMVKAHRYDNNNMRNYMHETSTLFTIHSILGAFTQMGDKRAIQIVRDACKKIHYDDKIYKSLIALGDSQCVEELMDICLKTLESGRIYLERQKRVEEEIRRQEDRLLGAADEENIYREYIECVSGERFVDEPDDGDIDFDPPDYELVSEQQSCCCEIIRGVDSQDRRSDIWCLGSLIEMIAELRDPRTIETLIYCLTDFDPNVRIAARNALEKMGEYKWAAIVKGNVRDFFRLGESGDTRLCGAFYSAMLALTGKEGDEVAIALGLLKDKRAIPNMCKILQRKDSFVVRSALRAIERIGVINCHDHLLYFVKRHGISAELIENLTWIPDAAVLKFLSVLLGECRDRESHDLLNQGFEKMVKLISDPQGELMEAYKQRLAEWAFNFENDDANDLDNIQFSDLEF